MKAFIICKLSEGQEPVIIDSQIFLNKIQAKIRMARYKKCDEYFNKLFIKEVQVVGNPAMKGK